MVVSTGVLMLGAGLRRADVVVDNRMVDTQFSWDRARWWDTFTPTHPLGPDLRATVPVTLKLIGTAFGASLVIGMLLGVLLSIFAPAWLRASLWGLTTMLHSVPDLVVVSVLDLAMVLIRMATALPVVAGLLVSGAAVALLWGVLLIALPGIPRVANAIRQQALQVMAQPFVESAHAVGAGTGRTMFKHILPQLAPQLATIRRTSHRFHHCCRSGVR